MLDSNLTKFIMVEEPQHGVESVEERAPRTHWIAERNKENDKEHRNQPITNESSSPHLWDNKEARLL